LAVHDKSVYEATSKKDFSVDGHANFKYLYGRRGEPSGDTGKFLSGRFFARAE